MEEVVSIRTNEDGTVDYLTESDINPKPKLDDLFPDVNFFLHRPLFVTPPMCSLRELQDGTYSVDDLYIMHELLDLKDHINKEG